MPTTEDLHGTSLAPAHIGSKPSARLAALLKDADLTPCLPVGTAGAEASNAIPVGLQLKDVDGNDLSSSRRLLCQVLDADMEFGAEAAFTMAESGAGAEVSTTAKAGLLITTDEIGAAEVTVTDVSTALAATVYLLVTPVDAPGFPALVSLTFA